MTLPYLGAYALVAGLGPDETRATYAALTDLAIAGLEVPLAAADAGDDWWRAHVAEEWDLVVTAIPTVMGRLAQDARYGLASDDEDGRQAALADVATAAALARRLADAAGRTRVTALQVHSAPRAPRATRDALARSLDDVAALDLAGALVTIEHCDATRPGWAPEKGFLEVDDELAVLAGRDARLTVNWGRSAIEGRSAAAPVEHVRAAASAGLLGGVMLSGATDAATAWGDPWLDGHIAPRGEDPALAASVASLLGPDEVRATLAAADGRAAYVGVKVTTHPDVREPAGRVAVARAALAQLAS
ncbi:DUF4862 family protein [Cellulomonas palmilytica]|uniref:DUF4862 family protein n=1 Tax=Cellulomonas palmilytica TaxID=2608402 RepID=UPI001F3CC633|nr:DUF4862 family protein [Cellulomonas palmilytica]UJP40751.1 DUF4862 family protein [Cellulomonas palmilytica]